MLAQIQTLLLIARAQTQRLKADERGSTAEEVIRIAVLAAAALTVLGIIVAKIIAKAQSIDLQ
ncbi:MULTISPECIES: hypothetical protein [Amycolatopsis]|uniref:Uncharacterized protein n=2 Tax=Amycolatopsis TaxID=1813 RepID=A0A1I4AC60_9PSEU|nr:hypothetical protein [Amycolatopsis sacchari]SFK53687.1 hypothetical protein SAMN05421835_123113 [Amycolatopsis sacchari]